ncbi:hypothetical protein LY90DRAFT_678420 [Neocallimastix californiae]|uniref:Uncharacterized protein n=1 Tax=Neocallimastix californiae TaxID=1754190 RepID=A0A1Y1Z6G2_9FUNG|nr:hypothetical protein LY90DRAFT_678420 [Neocallimastix californiae]|eukprot:ORY05892.1 hypothetical protein LY90DRAFT_678420 [Neocallimastix californiae]
MNSFKLFNRTNKNVNESNNLNGIETKEKSHSKSTHKIIINTSPSHINIKSTIDKSIEENKNNNQNKNQNINEYSVNENAKVNKENVSNIDISIKNKENKAEKVSKKEKSKKQKKKEKKKNKKNKKNKLNNDQNQLLSPTSSKSSTKSHFTEESVHHSSSLSKKDIITGKYTGKQSVRKQLVIPNDNIQPEILVKSYNESTQFQKDSLNDIKEKQSRIGNSSDEKTDNNIDKEIYISKSGISLTRPVRRESRIIGLKNNGDPIQIKENNAIIAEEDMENINTTPSTPTITPNKETSKDHLFRFNFDKDSVLNLPICLGMATPSSPAFSSITPINGNACYNNSLGDEFVSSFFADEDASNGEDNQFTANSFKLEYMLREEKQENIDNKNISKLHDVTENNQADQEPVSEVKEREVPLEFDIHNVAEERHTEESKYKTGKQKPSKGSKKKGKKANPSLSVNTKLAQNISFSNSNSSVSTASLKAPQRSVHSSNSAISETKKAWHSVRKFFGKNKSNNNHNNRKTYRNSFSTSIDDTVRHTYNSCNSGVTFDWDDLRRRMELEENSTVCSETLTAREFAEAIGMPIISSDEEDDLRLNAENNSSFNGNQSISNGYTGRSIYTHHSTKSSGPRLDMSIFIPPDKDEKKNKSEKRESLLNPDQVSASIKTTCSFASSTTQDYLDKLSNDTKRKVYEDSQSISNRELNLHRSRHGKFYDNDSISLSLNNERIYEFPVENMYDDTHYSHSLPYHVKMNSSPLENNHIKSKLSRSNSNNKSKLNLTTTDPRDFNGQIVKNENNKQDLTLNENKFIEQRELNVNKDNSICHQSQKSFNSSEIMKKEYPESLKSDVKSRKSCNNINNISQLEEEHSHYLSINSIREADNNSTKPKFPQSLSRRSPSFSSIRSYKTYIPPVVKSYNGEEAMVEEYQKGRFTVTKPILPPSGGHRVFIVTKDEENENGVPVTTVSSISSTPGKAALRKRSSSQPASFFNIDSDNKPFSPVHKRGNTSKMKYCPSITNPSETKAKEIVKSKEYNSLMATSQNYSNDYYTVKDHRHSITSNVVDSNKRTSSISFEITPMSTGYNNSSFIKTDTDNQDDTLSEKFILAKDESKLDKGKKDESLYSVDTNKSVSSLHKVSHSPTHTTSNVSPYSRPFKPKVSNSRFQVTYTPGALSPSNRSIHSMKSIDSSNSKVNLTKMGSRFLNDDTNSIEQNNKGNSFLSEPVTESNGRFNNSPILYNSSIEEEKIDHNPSSSSIAIKENMNKNISILNNLHQSFNNNNNNNQRTTSSLASVILDNGIRSNNSSPAISYSKISPQYGATRQTSLLTTSSVDNVHSEKISVLDNSVYSTPSTHRIHDNSNDYYNFLKYNDSYNSIYLSNSSKDNEKSENENNTLLDDMDKTEDNEILSEVDKTNDLSESSPSTPYYHNLNTPMEKPPIIPNSPISYNSISSLNNTIEENVSLFNKLPMKGNNNSNESFTIFDKDLNISGDESFHENHSDSLGRNDSKVSYNSLSTPTVKPSLLTYNNNNQSNTSIISNIGHYRSPSVSSTNSSSRFTVTKLRDNEVRSPSYSSIKVNNQRSSNLHNFTSISDNQQSSDDYISNETSNTSISSKLKPSVVVIKKPEDKSKSNGGGIVITTQSKNIGRFTVTRETIVS